MADVEENVILDAIAGTTCRPTAATMAILLHGSGRVVPRGRVA
jgi:hypothetical protein